MSITNFFKSVFTKTSENDAAMPQLKVRENNHENSGVNARASQKQSRNDRDRNTKNSNNDRTDNKEIFNLTSEQWCRVTDEFPKFSETNELTGFEAKDGYESTPVFDPNSFDLFDTSELSEKSSVNLNTENGEGSALLGKLFAIDHEILSTISYADAVRWRVLPLEIDNSTLTILCSEGTPKAIVTQHFANVFQDQNYTVSFQTVAWKTLNEYINHHYTTNNSDLISNEETKILENQKGQIEQLEAGVETATGIRFEHGSKVEEKNIFKTILSAALRKAHAKRATDCDIDLEYDHQERTKLVIKARIDRQQTIIYTQMMSEKTYVKMSTTIKSTLGLDTSSYHNCNSSRTRAELVYGNRVSSVEMRTNAIPNGRYLGAFTFSSRFQCRDLFVPTVENIGLFPDQIETVQEVIMRTDGMILISGGVNSGKNTTLHAFIKEITDKMPNKKVISIEDPVEANLPGTTQIQINPDQTSPDKEPRGYVYYTAHAMRHNPNILAVGETRDEKSAKFVLDGAETGQSMYSTFHSANATKAIERFSTMVDDPGRLADCLQAIVNQKLIRMNCKYCEKVVDRNLPNIPRLDEYLQKAGVQDKCQFMRSTGKTKDGSWCKKCNGTGLHGLIGVFEILTFPQKIRNMILKKAPSYKIRNKAIKKFGFKTLWINGLRRAATGDISLTELINETGYPDAEAEGLSFFDPNQTISEIESLN